jgi:hypothetical protein
MYTRNDFFPFKTATSNWGERQDNEFVASDTCRDTCQDTGTIHSAAAPRITIPISLPLWKTDN